MSYGNYYADPNEQYVSALQPMQSLYQRVHAPEDFSNRVVARSNNSHIELVDEVGTNARLMEALTSRWADQYGLPENEIEYDVHTCRVSFGELTKHQAAHFVATYADCLREVSMEFTHGGDVVERLRFAHGDEEMVFDDEVGVVDRVDASFTYEDMAVAIDSRQDSIVADKTYQGVEWAKEQEKHEAREWLDTERETRGVSASMPYVTASNPLVAVYERARGFDIPANSIYAGDIDLPPMRDPRKVVQATNLQLRPAIADSEIARRAFSARINSQFDVYSAVLDENGKLSLDGLRAPQAEHLMRTYGKCFEEGSYIIQRETANSNKQTEFVAGADGVEVYYSPNIRNVFPGETKMFEGVVPDGNNLPEGVQLNALCLRDDRNDFRKGQMNYYSFADMAYVVENNVDNISIDETYVNADWQEEALKKEKRDLLFLDRQQYGRAKTASVASRVASVQQRDNAGWVDGMSL